MNGTDAINPHDVMEVALFNAVLFLIASIVLYLRTPKDGARSIPVAGMVVSVLFIGGYTSWTLAT